MREPIASVPLRNIPFKILPSEEAVIVGTALHQIENAGWLPTQLSIPTPALVEQILGDPAHVATCNKFAHDLKTGKHTSARSLSGLLFTMLGIRKETTGGPLFDKPAKTH